jgi:hypothetical protein
MVEASMSLCRDIKLSSFLVILISLSLERVGLIFTTKLTLFNNFVLINDQKTTKIFKGVILTIFLVFLSVGAEIQN